MSVQRLSRLWQRLFTPAAVKPPYSHVVQLGDPALRTAALPVEPEDIQSPEVQEVISKLVKTMRLYKCAGLAAPQIGVPLRIIAVEVTKSHVKAHSPDQVAARQMEVTPLRVLLNPELTVEDYTTIQFPEGCASVRGITGQVDRYRSVSVSALTPTGEETRWVAHGWAARALQHEMDHLAGTLLLERCHPRSLEHQHWQVINTRAGRYLQHFGGYRDRQWGWFW